MVDILWKQGQQDTAIQLEDFWNDLSHTQEFSLLCTYSLDSLDHNTYDDTLERICKCHSHLVSMGNHDSLESGSGEAMLDVFEAAWNPV